MVVPTARELRIQLTEQAAASADVSATRSDAIEEAYKKCREITEENSKTFFLGSQFLAPDKQRAVWAIYNWCRATDELVDGPAAENTTMEDLQAWEDRLNKLFRLQDP